MTNAYCEILGIKIPELEAVKDHGQANTYALLIVALLERGGPMTLLEVAERLERAGVAPAHAALLSLKRCKPGRAPVYRDGDHYALDPHDYELDLWAFRLGLRPPRATTLPVARPEPEPIAGPEQSLSVAELDQAWTNASLHCWSVQRVVLAVLDSHREPMTPEDVVAFVAKRTPWHLLTPDSAQFLRRGSAVVVRDDGRWEIARGSDALLSARKAVRVRLEVVRRWAALRPDPAVMEANRHAAERRRAASASRLALMRRGLLHVFPAGAPEVAVLVDVGKRDITTFLGDELEQLRERLASYDIIGAVEVRGVLRALGFDPGARRLAELGPPQKSIRLARRRTLKITLPLLVQSSCSIARPFGDPKRLREYLREGETTRLLRRLETDARSLFAYYQYGRLHGAVRLRWRSLETMIPAPWVHRDEKTLYDLKCQAHELGVALDVVAAEVPGLSNPWARARRCKVEKDSNGLWLVEGGFFAIPDSVVQLARLATTIH